MINQHARHVFFPLKHLEKTVTIQIDKHYAKIVIKTFGHKGHSTRRNSLTKPEVDKQRQTETIWWVLFSFMSCLLIPYTVSPSSCLLHYKVYYET